MISKEKHKKKKKKRKKNKKEDSENIEIDNNNNNNDIIIKTNENTNNNITEINNNNINENNNKNQTNISNANNNDKKEKYKNKEFFLYDSVKKKEKKKNNNINNNKTDKNNEKKNGGIDNLKRNNNNNKKEDKKNNIINNYNLNNNKINGKELGIIIEDFIYYKKGNSIDEYKSTFEKMKLMIDNNKLNNNLMNSLIKLLRFLNNTRNFNEKIISMDFFIEFQNIIKNKILLFLFDISNLNLDEQNIEYVNIEELIKQIDNYYIELEQSSLSISSTKKANKNKIETNEKSIEVSSSGSKYDENKSKVIITPLDQSSIFELLNSLDDNNNLDLNMKETITNDDIIKIIKNISKINCNNNKIKDCFLRKKVCLKLYNLFKVLLKNMNLSKNDIKKLCIGLENKARNYDNEMSTTYKNYINHLFKLIRQNFI
jgi:hypothetical protein